MKKKAVVGVITLLASVSLMTGSVFAGEAGSKNDLVNYLINEATAENYISGAGNQLYNNTLATAEETTELPESFDLRDEGYVTEVKNQLEWSACWGFSSMAAAETSILSAAGITVDEYEKITGTKFELSPRHIICAAHGSLAEEKEGEDYPYPEYIDQAGEGMHVAESDKSVNPLYNMGGSTGAVANAFASGMGPVSTDIVPYEAKDGTRDLTSDWGIDASQQFASTYLLRETRMLPTPAGKNEKGEYEYNEAATNTIKQEILNGRAVVISFYAEKTMDKETLKAYTAEKLAAIGVKEDDIKIIIENPLVLGEEVNASAMSEKDLSVISYYNLVTHNLISPAEYSLDTFFETLSSGTEEGQALLEMIYTQGSANAMDTSVPSEEDMESLYETAEKFGYSRETLDAAIAAKQQQAAAMQAAMQAAGQSGGQAAGQSSSQEASQDEMAAMQAAGQEGGQAADQAASQDASMAGIQSLVFMNVDTYAHYVNREDMGANHGVCIVGWDDNYAVENFIEGQQPPAPGAWIVRNSWGENYGNDGYFYLSYYDKSITTASSFEFSIRTENLEPDSYKVLCYDFLAKDDITSVLLEKPVSSANIFTVDEDCVLTDVNVVSSEYDVSDTISVYLLNENSKSPEDGELLDQVDTSFKYAGYHTVELNKKIQLEKGARVAIVSSQSVTGKDKKTYYPLTYKKETSEAFMEDGNSFAVYFGNAAYLYSKAVINPGESFVCLDSEWSDWADIVNEVTTKNPQGEYFVYDNMQIKAYVYAEE